MVAPSGYNLQIERQAPSVMPQGCRAVGLKTRSGTPTLLLDAAKRRWVDPRGRLDSTKVVVPAETNSEPQRVQSLAKALVRAQSF